MNGLKIMCMKMEHLVFLDSVSFLPCPLRKLPEALGADGLQIVVILLFQYCGKPTTT
jgi:hypothetical protein